MKQMICLLLMTLLFACDSSQPKPQKKIREMRVFETRYDSGKETGRKLIEKKICNANEDPVSEFHYDENGSIENQSSYVYDSKGREIKSIEKWHGKLSYSCKTTYDKRDSIDNVMIFKPNKQLDFTIHAEYNQTGVNCKDLCLNADGSVKFWDNYTYNQSGKLEEWTRYNPDSSIQSKVIYLYDRQGREIKNTCSGELGGTYTFKYNQKGLKVEEIAYNTVEKTFLWLKKFYYDESNKLLKIVEYNDPKHRTESPYRMWMYEYTYW